MSTETATRPAIDPDTAARLERLAARTTRPQRTARAGERHSLIAPAADVDAALQARLDGLTAARRSAAHAPATSRKRRRHPAQHSRTAALALSFVATGGLGYLLAVTDPGTAAPSAEAAGIVPAAPMISAAGATAPIPVSALVPAAAAAPSSAASSAAAPAPAAPIEAAPASTQPIVVNGESFRNRWGDVQIQATFAPDGTLVAVDALQVPFRDGQSVRINDVAVPRLNSEALTAQNAQIDTVSGATYTSVGYKQSLQSAIDIAAANGIPVAGGQA